MVFAVVVFSFSSLILLVFSQNLPNCNDSVDVGHNRCKNPQKSIKYHFDKELEMCLPFLYEGCGGSRNRFDDSDFCMLRCRAADKGVCGGGSKSYGSCSARNKKCPKGSRCINMAFGLGLCCDEKILEEWLKENNPKCVDQKMKVVTESVWYGEQKVLGKSCSHKFCPRGSKCINGRWLAHCCEPIKVTASS